MVEDAARSPGDASRRYRCPVCGHVDATELGGAESAVVRCSHCDTHLEVRPRDGASLSARVARPRNGSRKEGA